MKSKLKKIKIVIPIHNEEGNIENLYSELIKQTSSIKKYVWSFIFVDDGSRDNSYDILKKINKKNKNVKIIRLSKNFGKEIALTAGLDEVNADAVIFMDADLQHPPYVIPELVKKWEKGSYIVSTLRVATEKKPLFRKLGSYIFYKIFNIFSDNKFIANTSDFKLIDKKVIEILKTFTERNRIFRGLIDWMGFETDFVEFTAPERISGKAGYSYKKLVSLAVNSITSFSLFPLKIAGYVGILITIISSVLLAFMIVMRYFLNSNIFSSIAFVIVGNTILMGIVLICLGLVALYIGQIHSEVVNRPLYVIKDKIDFNE